MVDVTVENFAALRPEIESELHSALFVAIDTEFTGLLIDASCANKCFDSGNDRYMKLRKNLQNISICQLGLAICKTPWRDINEYECSVYNMFLHSPSFLDQDPTIICQASSLSFLARHRFDFNKWVYSGIPFLSRAQEASLQQQLADMVTSVDVSKVPFNVRDAHRAVLEWSATASWDELYEVKDERSDVGCMTARVTPVADMAASGARTVYRDPSFAPMLLCVLHNTSPDLHATIDRGVIIVRKVSEAERNQLTKKIHQEWCELADGCLDWLTGCSYILWLISELKIPVVLHNGLLDLMLLYKQFFGPLPHSLTSFKRLCHAQLPKVYDTKLLSYELKRLHKEDEPVTECLSDTSLAPLAQALSQRLPLLFKPVLTVPQPNKYGHRECPHEAGYDAYLTATCFLQLSHLHFTCSLPQRMLCRALEPREHLSTLKPFVNKLNITRAAIVSLVGLACFWRPERLPAL
ncbi:Ribonuclease CAF1 [Trinorchestia longiramus]|nr:Ribonuclease CAF1 [Trinorchestia longiramus]